MGVSVGEGIAQPASISCSYLQENGLCSAIPSDKEKTDAKLGNIASVAIPFPNQAFQGSIGVIAKENESALLRAKFCTHELKNYCCYLCADREACDIGCTFLDKPEDLSRLRISKEIRKAQKTIQELAVFLANGQISKESYLNSVRTLEKRIESLKASKLSPQLRARAYAQNLVFASQRCF